MMKIERDEHGKNGAFYIDEGGEWVAELAYARSGGDKITITHTEVDPKLRGEGIGEDMVAEAVKFARENNLRIKATCPFAHKVLSENADYEDIFIK